MTHSDKASKQLKPQSNFAFMSLWSSIK